MTTADAVADYRDAVSDLSTVAISDIARLLKELEGAEAIRFRDELLEIVPSLVEPYLETSGQLAATWYEDLRAEAIGGTFTAATASDVPAEQLAASIRWSVAPLFGGSAASVLSLLAGSVQRMIADSGRATVITNVAADPVKVGYSRVPKAGCCAFCGMLASRGAVYANAGSAGGVVGRGLDIAANFREDGSRKSGGQARGVKARGVRELSAHYHDFCRCVAAPVFVGDTFHTAIEKKYSDLYQSIGGRPGEPQRALGTALTAQEVLRDWRYTHGTH